MDLGSFGKMVIMPRGVYSPQFRPDAVALVESGISQRQVCEDLGISKAALAGWLKASRAANLGLPASSGQDPAVRELVRCNRLLEQENEVLRRAAAYLSQAHVPKTDLPASKRSCCYWRPCSGASSSCLSGVKDL